MNNFYDNTLLIIAVAIVVFLLYLLVVWWIRKWLIKHQVACIWRSLFLAFCLAPGLMLYGEHTGVPLPSFAWMSAVISSYNCIEKGLFCSIKLNMLISILPFLATWIFAYFMCKGPQKK